MGIGSGIFLIVIGAILAFAIAPDTWDIVNLNVVGFICIAAGVLALILSLVYSQQRANTSHRTVVDHRDDRYDDRPPPPR